MDAVSLDPEAFARHQLTDEEWEAFDRDVRATPAGWRCARAAGDAACRSGAGPGLRAGSLTRARLQLPALPRAAPLRTCWAPSPHLARNSRWKSAHALPEKMAQSSEGRPPTVVAEQPGLDEAKASSARA